MYIYIYIYTCIYIDFYTCTLQYKTICIFHCEVFFFLFLNLFYLFLMCLFAFSCMQVTEKGLCVYIHPSLQSLTLCRWSWASSSWSTISSHDQISKTQNKDSWRAGRGRTLLGPHMTLPSDHLLCDHWKGFYWNFLEPNGCCIINIPQVYCVTASHQTISTYSLLYYSREWFNIQHFLDSSYYVGYCRPVCRHNW